MDLPVAAEAILMSFSVAFSRPTFQRVLPLIVGGILARGRRTVSSLLWFVDGWTDGHYSDYHRVFSRASWSSWTLGRVLARLIVELVPADERIVVAIDDTVDKHTGEKVYAKACHRDAVRSSKSHTAYKWGHKWITLAIVVKFPFLSRPWALPVLAALYRPKELNQAEGRRHKTPSQLARGLLAALMKWFPQRQFVFLGDGDYASHELSRFCRRHRKQCTLISRFYPDAALYDPPASYSGNGRPRVKGRKRSAPQEVVSARKRMKRATVEWYGCTQRSVKLVSGTGHWYRQGQGLVPVKWIFVRDETGSRQDEYFYCTQPELLSAEQIVEYYTRRWTIEVTFWELRTHLGWETTRQRTARSVLRMAPCLMGLFSIVALIYHEHWKTTRCRLRLGCRPGYEKREPTFSDALTTVRELFWQETVFAQPDWNRAFQNIPPKLKTKLLTCISQAL